MAQKHQRFDRLVNKCVQVCGEGWERECGTGVGCRGGAQSCGAEVGRRVGCMGVVQGCRAGVGCRGGVQSCGAEVGRRVGCMGVVQGCRAGVGCRGVVQGVVHGWLHCRGHPHKYLHKLKGINFSFTVDKLTLVDNLTLVFDFTSMYYYCYSYSYSMFQKEKCVGLEVFPFN